MKSRKNFIDCLHELVDSHERIQNRWLELNSIEPELHKEIISLPEKGQLQLFWEGSDIDLIELVTAVFVSGVIRSNRLRLERKELLGAFETLFNIKIKNSATKLSRARDRKKDPAPFLELLKQFFIKDSESASIRNN
jgi:hypothetical protein